MATARARTTKPAFVTEDDEPQDDVPSFTTPKAQKVVYEGPVLFRVDQREFRMRADDSFGASLVYLRRLGDGTSIRQAEFALLDYIAGAEATERLILAAADDPSRWTTVVNRAVTYVIGRVKEDPGN